MRILLITAACLGFFTALYVALMCGGSPGFIFSLLLWACACVATLFLLRSGRTA